jgi:hypothetical protein
MEELERMAAYDLGSPIDWDKAFEGGDNDALDAFFARSVLGCVKVAPILMHAMERDLEGADSRVRACAAMGVTALTKVKSLQSRAEDIQRRLADAAKAAKDSDERSSLVLALRTRLCSFCLPPKSVTCCADVCGARAEARGRPGCYRGIDQITGIRR